jgi:hypothetical protein
MHTIWLIGNNFQNIKELLQFKKKLMDKDLNGHFSKDNAQMSTSTAPYHKSLEKCKSKPQLDATLYTIGSLKSQVLVRM